MRIYFYIARKFWGPFFFALGVFTALVVLGDTFEKMKNLGNGVTTMMDLLSYSLVTFPNWLATIMPVACLLGAISVISEMVANGEWTACVASGFAPRQLFKPVILCILGVVLATMVLQEFVIPPLNAKSERIYNTRINPSEDPFNPDAERDVILKISCLILSPYASMVEMPRVVSSSTDKSTSTVSSDVNIVTLFSTAQRRISWPSVIPSGELMSLVLIT